MDQTAQFQAEFLFDQEDPTRGTFTMGAVMGAVSRGRFIMGAVMGAVSRGRFIMGAVMGQ